MAPSLESTNSYFVDPLESKPLHCITNEVKSFGREYRGSHLVCLWPSLILIPENPYTLWKVYSSQKHAHSSKK